MISSPCIVKSMSGSQMSKYSHAVSALINEAVKRQPGNPNGESENKIRGLYPKSEKIAE